MSRVLVTGATGFIGLPCLQRLRARGYEVHAVSGGARVPPGAVTGEQGHCAGMTWHQADLMDPGQVARLLTTVRPTHLLHLAWRVVPGGAVTANDNLRWVQTSLELLRGFRELGGSRVVMAGSSYEYDWRYGYCAEAVTPTVPATYYGTCKLALGQLLEGYAAQSGLSHAWARIFFVYGPRENPARLVSSVIRSLVLGEAARCSHARQIRDYLHVHDVADALVALLHSDVLGSVNIGSGRPVVVRDIVSRIATKLDQEALVQFGALPAHPHDVPLVVADVSRLTEEVKWRPQYDLDRGLDETIAWWRSELAVGAHSLS
ncbi:MAG: NAD-dependent epimerase/dehydratase family protein [Tepidiformaceae bacterium]